MKKENKLIEHIIDEDNSEIINNDIKENNEIEYKEELCKVIWIKNNSYSFDFQGYGISVHVDDKYFIDIEKIPKFINVKYIGTIGKTDFKYFPVYL